MKKSVAVMLVVVLMLTCFSGYEVLGSDNYSDALNQLGLLSNIGEEDLEKELTRVVGIAMIMKSLGYTQDDANGYAYKCSFTDMDSAVWGKGFVALAYEYGITTGKVDGVVFDPMATMSKKEFITFQLRALGYDKNDSWNMASELSVAAGISDGVDDYVYTKRDAAETMYNALMAMIVNSDQTLIEKHIADGNVDGNLAEAIGLASLKKSNDDVYDVADYLPDFDDLNSMLDKMDVISQKTEYNSRIYSYEEISTYRFGTTARFADGNGFVNSYPHDILITDSGLKLAGVYVGMDKDEAFRLMSESNICSYVMEESSNINALLNYDSEFMFEVYVYYNNGKVSEINISVMVL